MKLSNLSLKTLVVLLMSLLSMTLVVMAWDMYQDLAFESQKATLEELLSVETDRILENLEHRAEDVGMPIQASDSFTRALTDLDKERLADELDNQFQQYAVSSAGFKLIQLYAYNKSFDVVGWSREGPSVKEDNNIICRDLIDIARQRQGANQHRILSGLCQWQGRAYFSVLLSVGGLNHQGYLQLVIDPLASLASIETYLDLPMMITMSDGEDYYRSENWLANDNDALVATHTIMMRAGQPLLQLAIQRDLSSLVDGARDSRNRLILVAGFLTFFIVVFSLWLMERFTVRPIRSLIDRLNEVRNDRRSLGVPLQIDGNSEVVELVQVFNAMSKDLANLYDKYEDMAFIDQLTSLPNRTLFLDRLNQMILMSARKGERFGVMLLDLDGFKDVNDTLGHQVGDKLLQRVGERLKNIMRASSTVARLGNETDSPSKVVTRFEELTVARLGGDEFAILLPNLGHVSDAISVAKRITEALELTLDIDGNIIVIAGTLGIAMYPDHGEDGESLLRRADVALYVAKHIQSDFSVYDPAYDRHSVTQLSLKAELRSAIEQDQMVLFYQPKLNIRTDCVDSLEALVRWQHPQRGLIPPDQFIPLSEQRGLIGPLTEWVIKRALSQYKEWRQQGITLQIAVNLSSRVLYDLSLPNKIEQFLRDQELPPEALSLEITEDATMVDPKRALDILNRLDQMGVSLSIDDFGTGHSSLGYLKRLPVDEIKIDRTFVMEMEQSENDAKIVHATIDLAHNLGLKVVAEGVETKGALKMLKTLNCDYAQGYYLSRPIPAAELLVWLQTSGLSCKIV